MGRIATKNTTSYYRQLDIRDFRRKGFLRPQGWISIFWWRNGEVVGSIRLCAEFDRLYLRYRCQRYGGEWEEKEYSVFLDSTPCNYGGTRLWFLCPGQNCSRRVAVLYGGTIFACRHCYGLVYDTQRELPYGRALIRAQAIRTKLGGSPSMAEDFPNKPKGMHWMTYSRLCHQYEEAQDCSWPPWILRTIATRS